MATRKLHPKRWFKLLTGSILFLAVIIIGCNLIIIHQTSDKCFNNLSDLPHNKVGLLLGTSPLLKSGRVNPYFQYRIEAAAELYDSGKIEYVLVSGDNSRNDYNEPLEMQKALIERGIPAGRIFFDYAGLRTLDSVVRAQKIFGQRSFTVISQRFHNERAVYIAGKYEIDAIGYNARDVGRSFGFKTRKREWLARVKVFVDLLMDKQPRYLGEEIDIP